MPISREQREKNKMNRTSDETGANYVAMQGYKKGEQGRKGRIPNMGNYSRATYHAAHDLGSDNKAGSYGSGHDMSVHGEGKKHGE